MKNKVLIGLVIVLVTFVGILSCNKIDTKPEVIEVVEVQELRTEAQAIVILDEFWPFIQQRTQGKVSYDECLTALCKLPHRSVAQMPCFDITDILEFLAVFGVCVPDLIPIVPNDYFQDANCNVAKWTAQLKERDPSDSTTNNYAGIPVNIVWELDGDPPISTGSDWILPFYTYNLENCQDSTWNEIWGAWQYSNCDTIIDVGCPGIFSPSCNGAHNLVITMTMDDGSVYQRAGTAYGQVNFAPFETCTGVTIVGSDLSNFDFDCFCPLTFTEHEFLIESGIDWDLTNDGCVNSGDLLILLSNFCG